MTFQTYDIDEVLSVLARDPEAAILNWEQAYQDQIKSVADFIAENRKNSPVVLLAGPSASSKTSTAGRIRGYLADMGIGAHLLSMDNYFIDRDAAEYPTLPDGSPDLESPECLDMELLDEHFATLERGEDIYVPEYDNQSKKRVPGEGNFLDAEMGDVFIFEGIHALNERFSSKHPNASRVYVSPEVTFVRNGETFCTPVQLRLMRRIVRDHQFRSASAEYSLSLWGNVIASEAMHVVPYQATANCLVSTALPYEIGVLKRFVKPLIETLPRNVPCRSQVDGIRQLLKEVPKLNPALVPDGSILREFIGPRPAVQED